MSVIPIVPVRVPDALGVKATEIVHLAPTATDPPQVFVSEKSPVATMLEMASGALPILLSVTF